MPLLGLSRSCNQLPGVQSGAEERALEKTAVWTLDSLEISRSSRGTDFTRYRYLSPSVLSETLQYRKSLDFRMAGQWTFVTLACPKNPSLGAHMRLSSRGRTRKMTRKNLLFSSILWTCSQVVKVLVKIVSIALMLNTARRPHIATWPSLDQCSFLGC